MQRMLDPRHPSGGDRGRARGRSQRGGRARTALAGLVFLFLALGARSSAATIAQDPPSGGPGAPAPAAEPPTAPSADLAPEPLDAEVLGLTMQLPVGTAVRIDRSATTSYLLSDASGEARWRVRVSTLQASRAGTTAKSQCEDYLADLAKRGEAFATILDEPRSIDGRDAHLFYIALPLENGGRGISGTLVVPRSPDDYLVFSILAVDEGFARTKDLLDRSFATIRLRDPAKVAAERADLAARGAAMLASIDEKALRSAIRDEPIFYRMWRPDPQGRPKELGYLVVRIREGARGEVDASRDARSLKGAEADKGLLATVDARMVVNDDPTHTLDVQSRYFTAWDRQSESWSMRSTERQKRASRSSAQTGLRIAPTAGAPRPKLTVITASRDGMTREPQEWTVPPNYISQAELVILGHLLPKSADAEPVEFIDYAFDQREEKLPQRRETWSRRDAGWRLETRSGGAPGVLVQEFDAAGVRTRRVDPDGTVTERIELEALRALWKSKGLPVS